jgi:hypothetical protein
MLKKTLIQNNHGWWIVWPSTGNDAWTHWHGPYRWRWLAATVRWCKEQSARP